MSSKPDFSLEAALKAQGFHRPCGTDEAGRGPLAGPVVAAAVILDPANVPEGLNDSKKLSETRRTALFGTLMRDAWVSVSIVSAATIDAINIRAASLLAMRHAICGLEIEPDFALIDGNALPPSLSCQAQCVVKGDSKSLSIAAASIVAKVTRDRIMIRHDTDWPEYGFAVHKGYPTGTHREAVKRLGPCPLHRRSFAPVKDALQSL